MIEKTERKFKKTGKNKGGQWENIVKLSIIKGKICVFYVHLNGTATL